MKMNGPLHNGYRGFDAIDFDIIQEFLDEKQAQMKLPGPPAPPPDPDDQIPKPVVNSAPVLVSRGTAPQRHTPVHLRGMSGFASSRPAKSQHRGSAMSRVQSVHTGTEQLEHLLNKPTLVVVEEPKERGMRFRYECEGRSAGSILGASSTEVNKTLPAIELQGPIDGIKYVTVTVSLVTKDIPHRPHPHCLVGKDCLDGICVISFSPQTARKHSFVNLGIQCVRRKELDASLMKRKKKNIDPFNTGHSKSIEDMDMNVVRLCFQCELERDDGERIQLSPVLSNPIYDKKATTTAELKINRLNIVRGPCTGKTEIYMLCDKVQKDDIEIIFGVDNWEAKAEFAQTDVHRQIAIVFKSPPYQEQDITEEIEVNVCLRRISDRMYSEPVKFIYTPDNGDPYEVKRKQRIKSDKSDEECAVAPVTTVNPPNLFEPFNYDMMNPISSIMTQGNDQFMSQNPQEINNENMLPLPEDPEMINNLLYNCLSEFLPNSSFVQLLSNDSNGLFNINQNLSDGGQMPAHAPDFNELFFPQEPTPQDMQDPFVPQIKTETDNS